MNKGFSLIEISISIFIIGLLSVFFLTNYQKNQNQKNIIYSAQEVINNLREAQTYALGLKEFKGQAPGGGWGIYLNTLNMNNENNTSYVLFADLNNNKQRNTGEDLRTINLMDGVKIKQLKQDSTIVNHLTITYQPPDPKTNINDDSNAKNAEIILIDNNLKEKTIKISTFGLIE